MIESEWLGRVFERCKEDLTPDQFLMTVRSIKAPYPDSLVDPVKAVNVIHRWQCGWFEPDELEFLYAIIFRYIKNLEIDVKTLKGNRDLLAARMGVIKEIAEGMRNE